MNNVLVVGYPGWLASRLVEDLTGYNVILGTVDIKVLNHIPNAVYCDLTKIESINLALKDIDYVINCAGIIHPKDIFEYYQVNMLGVLNLCKATNNSAVKRLIHISSNAVSGRSESNTIRTEADTDEPLNHYGRSKLYGETIIKKVLEKEYIILRPCMFYSKTLPKRHLDVLKKMKYGIFPIFGSGNYYRSVVSVADLSKAAVQAINSTIPFQVYYVCDNDVYTTKQIIYAMAKSVGVNNIKLVRLPRILSRIAYIIDTYLQSKNIYIQSLHLIGEADWSVGYSNEKLRSTLPYTPSDTYLNVISKKI